jgi:protein-disulfide isomerase
MNYLLNLWRLPILLLVLSSLCLGALPARSAPQIPTQTRIAPEQSVSTDSNSFDLLTNNPAPKTDTLLAQSIKVNPQLEKQILEVIRRHPDVMLEVLQKYAIEQQQKDQKAQAEVIKQVRKNTKALIGDSPTIGAANRQIVMVEFSDFQCQFCAAAEKNVKEFMTKHKEVTLVYKHFPLTQIHPEALPAARAAWAASKQGKFWEYHNALFANQAKLAEPLYLETANTLKLDINKFNADRKAADSAIVRDFTLGRKLGIDGTPTFIINGEVVSGAATVADLEKVLAQVTKK